MASASPSSGIRRAPPWGPTQAMAELDVPKSMPSVPAGEDIMRRNEASGLDSREVVARQVPWPDFCNRRLCQLVAQQKGFCTGYFRGEGTMTLPQQQSFQTSDPFRAKLGRRPWSMISVNIHQTRPDSGKNGFPPPWGKFSTSKDQEIIATEAALINPRI